MKTTELTWGDLHDATLETVEIRWDTGAVVLRIRTGDRDSALLHLVASSMRHLTCDRRLPWGPSVSIHNVRGPALAADGGPSCLEIEMQSGDVLRIEAAAFTIESVPASSGQTARLSARRPLDVRRPDSSCGTSRPRCCGDRHDAFQHGTRGVR